MNANELIVYCKQRVEHHESFVKAFRGIINPNMYDEEVGAYNEIISALSRSRIRDTATEPPTEEDSGTFDGMTGMILARTWRERAIAKDWEIVERDPTMYPQWTCVPQLPEVE